LVDPIERVRQTSGAGCFPIPFWIVANVKHLIRFEFGLTSNARAEKISGSGFVCAYLAGDEIVAQKKTPRFRGCWRMNRKPSIENFEITGEPENAAAIAPGTPGKLQDKVSPDTGLRQSCS